MGSLNKRQRLFTRYYTDNTGDTCGNAYKSAIKAGYTDSYARTTIYKLLEKASIKAELERLELENRKTWLLSREEAIAEAYKNYCECDKATIKKSWWDTYVKMLGYVDERNLTQINVAQAQNTAEQDQKIIEAIRKERLESAQGKIELKEQVKV